MTAPRRRPGLRTLTAGFLLVFVATAASSSALVVRPGDSLWALAERHHTTVATLQELNALQGRTTIFVGETLQVPQAPPNQVPAATARSVARHRAEMAQRTVLRPAHVKTLIARTARAHGVDPALALAVAYQESGFQQQVVSAWDGIGAMQVLPSTGREMNSYAGRHLDLLRAHDNVLAGVLLLRNLLHATRSVHWTLAGYFQGLGSVHRQGVLPQTQTYIQSVDALRGQFARE